jgi:hypothetical protein
MTNRHVAFIPPPLSPFLLKEGCRACFGDGLILLAHAAANANGFNHLTIPFERNASGKDHYTAIIGRMDAKKLAARLRMLCKILCSNIECSRGKGFFDGDIDAADPGPIHTFVCDQISASVNSGDIHWPANLSCLFLAAAMMFLASLSVIVGTFPFDATDSYEAPFVVMAKSG